MAARHAGRQRYAWLLMVGLSALVVTLATTQAQAPKAGAEFHVKAYETHKAMTQASPYKDQSWSFLGPTNVSGRIADVAVADYPTFRRLYAGIVLRRAVAERRSRPDVEAGVRA